MFKYILVLYILKNGVRTTLDKVTNDGVQEKKREEKGKGQRSLENKKKRRVKNEFHVVKNKEQVMERGNKSKVINDNNNEEGRSYNMSDRNYAIYFHERDDDEREQGQGESCI